MTIHQKIAALMRDRRHRVIAERVGVNFSTLYLYSKDTMPRADIAAKLARVLGVDGGWLIDDEQNWPPIPCKNPIVPTLPTPETSVAT